MPPLSGTESALSSALYSSISSKLSEATGNPISTPPYLQALCDAIAETIIPHLVSNIQVNPGQVVPATGLISTAPGSPVIGVTATSTNGTIT